MKAAIVILALVAALASVGVAAGSSSPVGCFRAHGWSAKGTVRHGSAHLLHRAWVQWNGPAPYAIMWFTSNRSQRRVIRVCLGR